jgi:hypothetical protein
LQLSPCHLVFLAAVFQFHLASLASCFPFHGLLNEQHVAQQLPPKCYAAAENITILAPNNSIGDWALQIVIDSWRRKLWSAAVQLFSISHRTLVANYPIVPKSSH